ncbi:NUDIX domain-containing protein [Bacillus timonensis]|nr:NUDIX domain-containing protein [Bacillus timonensis]
MNDRPRAFATLIQNDNILMVRIVDGEKEFWTLPGGGLENGESFEDAVIREVLEEVQLNVKVVKHLFTSQYEGGIEKCYLVEPMPNSDAPTLGFDPELPKDHQVLKEVKWQPMKKMADDIHVKEVMRALGIEVIKK